MIGTVAVTDEQWYQLLLRHPEVTEVNFWRPSARRTFSAPEFSPFFFKLHAPAKAICGFGFFARYSRLPVWLAWETFGVGNGCSSLQEMQERLARIRKRISYRPDDRAEYIGCTLIVQPTFFPEELWIRQPADWHDRTVTDKKYDLENAEGRRIWMECLARTRDISIGSSGTGEEPRYGSPVLVQPRLGQRTFRIAVTDAYQRACAVTGEHSLPALDAGHIRPYAEGGVHDVSNGLLLRADLHRLFDKGYLTVTPDLRVEISSRLKAEFSNGKTYYPLHGRQLRLPAEERFRPAREMLVWHNENCFAA